MYTAAQRDGFTKNLIKGKIAEMVFERMLRDTGDFTVINFGYEHLLPELTHHNELNRNTKTIEAIRTAPDFAIIGPDKMVKLVEVKYKSSFRKSEVLKNAIKMSESWNPSYIFLATPEQFYFDEISNIILNNGDMAMFDHPSVSYEVQERHLKILKDCEPS